MATVPASRSGDPRRDPDEDFLIQPSWRAGRAWARQPAFVKYRKHLLGFVVAINLLVLLSTPLTHVPRYLLEVSLGLTLLVVPVSAIWLWWYRSAAIRVTADLVMVNHFLRRPVVIRRRDIVRVARCGVVQVDISPMLPQPVVFMFGPDGHCLISFG